MAITADQKILTLDYWKRADKVVKGDYVFDRLGNPCQVTLVQDFPSKAYKITFSDHLQVSGNGDMSFLLETPKYRSRLRTYKGTRKFMRPLALSPIKDLLNKDLMYRGCRHYYSLPTCGPLKFPHQDLPVPPFVFGFWYWNRLKPNMFSVPELNAETVMTQLRGYGYEILNAKKQPSGFTHFALYPSVESQFAPFLPREIPNNYLLASENQRLELLSGIINARIKQYKVARDMFHISSTAWQEIRRMQALVESIGCKTLLFHNVKRSYYLLTFRTKYKLCDHQDSPAIKVHQTRRYITKIEELPTQQCVHIETTGLDGSFLVGEGFITCR
jgi:hypothetical protein